MPRAKKNRPTLDFENNLFSRGAKLIAGMDEVGRGCLAGPVSVGVAVINIECVNPPENLADSKLLTHEQREELLPLVQSWVIDSFVGHATNQEIDQKFHLNSYNHLIMLKSFPTNPVIFCGPKTLYCL